MMVETAELNSWKKAVVDAIRSGDVEETVNALILLFSGGPDAAVHYRLCALLLIMNGDLKAFPPEDRTPILIVAILSSLLVTAKGDPDAAV